MPGGGPPPGGGDKPPGVFHVKSFEDAVEAKAKIDALAAANKEFTVITVVYKDVE